eukprot:2491543-Pleurochrysis_carterae.AAC.1
MRLVSRTHWATSLPLSGRLGRPGFAASREPGHAIGCEALPLLRPGIVYRTPQPSCWRHLLQLGREASQLVIL